MMWKNFRNALLAGLVLVAGVSNAWAGGCCGQAAVTGCQSFKTICVTEWVAENYQTTRTVYKSETRQETYTAYREECVPETRTRTFTVYHKVPETRTEMRTVCEYVPCVEERTVMKKVTVCKPVTTIHRKCVDRGHYECRTVEVGPSLMDRLRKMCSRNDCCDPCNEPCPRYKTKKVWVPCKVIEECPVTKMVKCTECVPTTCKVTVCKKISKQVAVQVCCYKCVPETKTETYTVNVKKCVPYQATRCVKVCVPHQEQVTCCRMVPRQVSKQVPVCEDSCCYSACCHKKWRFGR